MGWRWRTNRSAEPRRIRAAADAMAAPSAYGALLDCRPPRGACDRRAPPTLLRARRQRSSARIFSGDETAVLNPHPPSVGVVSECNASTRRPGARASSPRAAGSAPAVYLYGRAVEILCS